MDNMIVLTHPSFEPGSGDTHHHSFVLPFMNPSTRTATAYALDRVRLPSRSPSEISRAARSCHVPC
ncbi:hypothetical protein SCLCIDRAFT_1222939 [Scleroderma citrinum Foug A]|uniref:Uncharacterized protein n=1 Tax=Scleroderma citrinum Foug A TaxID=1036808 RepID=A0A0C3CXJ8_9AGAM|nr:hypothetical protein SCLCIDRAFT_1222939 [Scleroderma citrinum Foug A]